jgi:hypothetical protein
VALVGDRRWWVRTVAAVAVHPSLWLTAIGQLRRLAVPGWWRRPPFLPQPDPAYLRFRLVTAYGAERPPDPADVVTYLRWCKAFPGAKGSTVGRGTRR